MLLNLPHRTHLESVLSSQIGQFWQTGHVPIVAHDLANHARWWKAC